MLTTSKMQVNDINLLINPFPTGSIEYQFVEDYYINTNEIGPGSLDKLLARIKEVDYEQIKTWLLENMTYYVFLRTTYWKIIATEVKRRANYKCSLCGSGRDLQTHHDGYNIHGNEHLLEDLQCLCQKCHLMKIHGRDIIESKKQRQKNKQKEADELGDEILQLIPKYPGIAKIELCEKMSMKDEELENHLTNLLVKGKITIFCERCWAV